MLQIEHLTITHKKDLRTILADLSLTLNDGDRAAIIGEEGNGKSTLLKLLHDPDSVSGYVQWEGRISTGRARLGYLAQQLTPEEMYLTAAEFWDGGAPADPGRAAKLLNALGLSRESPSQATSSISCTADTGRLYGPLPANCSGGIWFIYAYINSTVSSNICGLAVTKISMILSLRFRNSYITLHRNLQD